MSRQSVDETGEAAEALATNTPSQVDDIPLVCGLKAILGTTNSKTTTRIESADTRDILIRHS
jgi:hypothetical protein